MTRRYKQSQRALSQEETRARIVEATVALHENPGPRATTISAIAEKAGVQRLTVYRHFPDEASLFKACSSHWEAQNPPPDPSAWAEIADAHERARTALVALYGYYRRTRGMLTSVLRDEPYVAEITPNIAGMRVFMDALALDLAKGFADAHAAATLRHAVQFQTWVSLAEICASDGEAAALVVSWLK